MISKKVNKYFLVLILLSMAVSPAFALGIDKQNLYLIGVMFISPIVILRYKMFYKNDRPLALFMLSLIAFPIIFHPETMRWSTVLYTIMFGLTFIAYKQLLYRNSLNIISYLNFLKYLIYAYTIVLIIQQFCVLTGLPIFNLSNYNPAEPWKLNSLMSEPSHSARIVALLMFCFITIKELVTSRKYNFSLDFKTDKWVWLGFIWTMITMGSGTAFIFLFLVLLKFVRFKNMMILAFISIGILVIINFLGLDSFDRAFKTFMATLTLDQNLIYKADGSAAYRIIPIIIVAQKIDLVTLNGWFGHGVDFVGSFLHLSPFLHGLPEGRTGGGLFQIWIDFGFVSFILFLIFNVFNIFKKRNYLSFVFWIMLVFIQGINSQIVWLCIILLFTNKYFQNHFSKTNYFIKSIKT